MSCLCHAVSGRQVQVKGATTAQLFPIAEHAMKELAQGVSVADVKVNVTLLKSRLAEALRDVD